MQSPMAERRRIQIELLVVVFMSWGPKKFFLRPKVQMMTIDLAVRRDISYTMFQ